jgi:hypothetical protein
MLIFITRVLLATIRDKGICPCPRCLTPKSKMDQTGAKRDSQFREKNVRKYLLNYVCAARDAIYKNAFAIGGAIIWGPTRQRWWCARGCNVAWCWYWRPYRIVVVPVVI